MAKQMVQDQDYPNFPNTLRRGDDIALDELEEDEEILKEVQIDTPDDGA